jgi:hypothetical protein
LNIELQFGVPKAHYVIIKMRATILIIIAFIGFSITGFAQDKKLDSLYSDFEGSVMKSTYDISERYGNGCIFSMRVIIDLKGNLKSLTISDNIEKSLIKDFLVKNKNKLKLSYFKELAKLDKLKTDAIYIVPVIFLNSTIKAKIEVDDPSTLIEIFRYDDLKDNLKNVAILRPCVIRVATRQ